MTESKVAHLFAMERGPNQYIRFTCDGNPDLDFLFYPITVQITNTGVAALHALDKVSGIRVRLIGKVHHTHTGIIESDADVVLRLSNVEVHRLAVIALETGLQLAHTLT